MNDLRPVREAVKFLKESDLSGLRLGGIGERRSLGGGVDPGAVGIDAIRRLPEGQRREDEKEEFKQ